MKSETLFSMPALLVVPEAINLTVASGTIITLLTQSIFTTQILAYIPAAVHLPK